MSQSASPESGPGRNLIVSQTNDKVSFQDRDNPAAYVTSTEAVSLDDMQ